MCIYTHPNPLFTTCSSVSPPFPCYLPRRDLLRSCSSFHLASQSCAVGYGSGWRWRCTLRVTSAHDTRCTELAASFCYTSSRVSHSRPQSRSPEVKVYSRSRRGEAQGVMEASRAHLAPPRASLRTPPPPPPPPPPRIQRRSPRRLEPARHMPGIHMDTWTSWTWTSDEYGGGVVTQGGPVGRVEAISR